jgi:AraC-like DNA-binding protein
MKFNPAHIAFLLIITLFIVSCNKQQKDNNEAEVPNFQSFLDDQFEASRECMNAGDYQGAIERLLIMEEHISAKDTANYIKVLFRLGTSYSNQGAYAQSLVYFQKGQSFTESIKDSVLNMKFAANIGILYSRINDTSNAEKIFKEIIEQYDQLKDAQGEKVSLSPVKNSLGVIYKERQELDHALQLFREAYNEEHNSIQQAGILNNIGTVYRLKQKLPEAHTFTDQAIQIVDSIDRVDHLVFYYSNKVKIYLAEEEYSKAKAYLHQMQSMYDTSFSWMVWKNYMEVQIDYYSVLGEYEKAYELSQDYYEKERNEQQSHEIQQFYNALVEIQANEQNEEIKAFHTKHEIYKLTVRNQAMLIGFSSLMIVLLAIIIWQVYRRYRKVNDLYKSLVEKNKQLLEEKKVPSSGEPAFETKANDINPALKAQLIEKLKQIDLDPTLLYDPELTIDKLARQFSTNQKYLSQIINEVYKCNFTSFINERRVMESCKLFMNPQYDQFTIEGIALEVGFTNKATFNRAFKKYTQLTPSVFRKHCK